MIPRTAAEGGGKATVGKIRGGNWWSGCLSTSGFKDAAHRLLQKQQIEAATWTNPAIRPI